MLAAGLPSQPKYHLAILPIQPCFWVPFLSFRIFSGFFPDFFPLPPDILPLFPDLFALPPHPFLLFPDLFFLPPDKFHLLPNLFPYFFPLLLHSFPFPPDPFLSSRMSSLSLWNPSLSFKIFFPFLPDSFPFLLDFFPFPLIPSLSLWIPSLPSGFFPYPS
ncbi:hypothetical protein L211DRAFT_248510 [Terfezia boudieri ATCC MYA-4762]|uniref:Uncharacterized protein n=1 Tax=Terfezia boudieri ATCC MYA-4762 TaxID=1051890 RepID=A0A3N4ML64_9PEZI|nr:hypothetical protein L211DRAFT_248510 [Terfezia boudieri ATCC MYA-4762]